MVAKLANLYWEKACRGATVYWRLKRIVWSRKRMARGNTDYLQAMRADKEAGGALLPLGATTSGSYRRVVPTRRCCSRHLGNRGQPFLKLEPGQ